MAYMIKDEKSCLKGLLDVPQYPKEQEDDERFAEMSYLGQVDSLDRRRGESYESWWTYEEPTDFSNSRREKK